MGRRKNYSLDAAPKRARVDTLPVSPRWRVMVGDAIYDLSPWRYHNVSGQFADRDDLLISFCTALESLARFLSPTTLQALCRSGLPRWFHYLDARVDSGQSAVRYLADIQGDTLEAYAVWLLHCPARTASGRHSYSGSRTLYSQCKSILLECINLGMCSRDCLPDNPFPDSNRAQIPHRPYSRNEMRRLLAALATDLAQIRRGEFRGAQSERLLVYILLIAAKTGRNPTPLFELRRDALQPHPLKPDTHALLMTYKRRGNNIAVQSLRRTREIESAVSIRTDIATLFQEVCLFTASLVNQAPQGMRHCLWLFERDNRGKYGGGIACLNTSNTHYAIGQFVAKHDLRGDDIDPASGEEKPFQLTFMRLRKTFASRLWHLTGGDVVRTASALGNQPPVTDTHYLSVTPEMVRRHRFVGMCLEASLRGKADDPATVNRLAEDMQISVEDVKRCLDGQYNTGVGRCSSPFYGKFAPQTGEAVCTDFLHCFRCPNQVVMESDLYRLFSFYWLLIKVRSRMERRRWHQVYGWVIREIDQVIAPRFPVHRVQQAREAAHRQPHPLWQDLARFGGHGE
ncbi:integrase [Escherichia coli]|nr:integrase [Escherichia coli]EHZ8215177.1 integrase [Escherichia coli]ELM5076844.1 integrase [Escherichia coli]HDU8580775.1 integrase [Morganella morganii]